MLINPRTETTAFLLEEEKRLIELVDTLRKFRFMRGAASSAANTLACVQRELTQRGQ